jgi:hypothetical protein
LAAGARVRIYLSFYETAAVETCEREMFERTSAAARQSARVQEVLAAPDASQKMLAFSAALSRLQGAGCAPGT